jgi:hypothetical protein
MSPKKQPTPSARRGWFEPSFGETLDAPTILLWGTEEPRPEPESCAGS